MKINLKEILKDGRDANMVDPTSGETLTLETISYIALSSMTQQEVNLGRDERLKRGRLAQRIVSAENGEIDLKSEEITLIKQCIGNSFGPWVVAQTEDMLDPQTT